MAKGKIGSIIFRVSTILSVLLLIGIGCILLFIFLPSSANEKTVILPDVTNKDLISAVNILYQEKLKVNKIYEEHTLPKNYIISQNPLPGTKVKAGRRIELKVSSGKGNIVKVPNIENISVIEAKHKLRQLSNQALHIGRLSYVYSSIEKDYVVAQNPLPNVKIPEDSEVNLLISKGNRPISFYMPELTGMKLEEASEIIKKIGLRITRVEEEICDAPERGTILEQKPLRGYRVSAGDGLTLLVANNTSSSSLFEKNTSSESKNNTISN